MQTSIYKLAGVVLLLINTLYNYGQSKISGTVYNSQNQPLADASVLLLNSKDSSLVKGTITTRDGQYYFAKVTKGNYIIASSFVHYMQSYTAPISISEDRQQINEPALILSESAIQLGNVVVEKKKPLVEVLQDRLVVNVAGSITAAGGTALEVLERSPGVMVDPQNNSVIVNGKSDVVIMINGKISRVPVSSVIQLLEGMNADNIEKIEIITTPPASFDAEGNAGYINIVLKNNNQYGANGSCSAMVGYTGEKLQTGASFNFNHRKGKFNLYGDYSFSRRGTNTPGFLFYHKVIDQGKANEIYTYLIRDNWRTVHDGRLGVDYEVTKKTVIGFLATYNDNKWVMRSNNRSDLFTEQVPDTTILVVNNEINHWLNYTTNINLQHNYSDNEKLSVNADYVHYKDNNPNNYLNSYLDGNQNFLFNQNTQSAKLTPISFWIGSVDYSKKISTRILVEVGVKETISRFNNEVSVERQWQNEWVTDKSLSNSDQLKENIGAAYTSFNSALNEKTNLKLGLRYEHTNSNLGSAEVKNILDRHYGNLFPSFFISHAFDENNSVSFSYSRRITRPTFNDLAPFVIFFDPYTFFSGNPGLKPTIADALKADYQFKKIVVSLFYTYEKNPITNYTPTIDSVTNKETSVSENQKNKQSGGISLSIPLKVTTWWNMQINITGIWQKLNGIYAGLPLVLQNKNLSANSTQSFKLPNDISVELTTIYMSPTLFGIYKTKAMGWVNFGVQKKLGQNSGTLRFSIENLTGPPKYILTVNSPGYNLVSKRILPFFTTGFNLTYSRNFGNQKLKAKRDRSTGAEDEKGRVNY